MTTKTGRQLDAIVFDVGGLIVDHENHLIYERLAARCTSPGAREVIEQAIADPHWDTGAAPVADLHAQLARELGFSGDWDAFLDDWTCHFTLNESMLALLGELGRHERVILFSNTNKAHWDYLLAQYPGAFDPFERFLSHEIHLRKPTVAAFTCVADKAGITPSRSLFFDDRLDNVEGARRAGFPAEVFVGETELKRQLASLGIEA